MRRDLADQLLRDRLRIHPDALQQPLEVPHHLHVQHELYDAADIRRRERRQ